VRSQVKGQKAKAKRQNRRPECTTDCRARQTQSGQREVKPTPKRDREWRKEPRNGLSRESARELGREPAGEPVKESGRESGRESAEVPGEELAREPGEERRREPAQKRAEELTGELGKESAGEPGEELAGEPGREPTEERGEEPAAELGGEFTGEPGEDSTQRRGTFDRLPANCMPLSHLSCLSTRLFSIQHCRIRLPAATAAAQAGRSAEWGEHRLLL
jgi:hypothetical protein